MVKIALFLLIYLALGTLFVSIISWVSPKRLINSEGFRQDVAFWMLIVWPVPVFVLIVRLLLLPSKLLANRTGIEIEKID